MRVCNPEFFIHYWTIATVYLTNEAKTDMIFTMDKKFSILLSIFFLAFILFVTLVIFDRPLTSLIRASQSVPSETKSLMFAWPLKAAADGTEESVVTVFVRSEDQKPIEKKQVNLTTSVGTVKESNQSTDTEGKATFHVVSSTPGTAEIRAVIDGTIQMTQSVSVKFE